MVSLIKSRWDTHFGGILLVCVIAAAATFLSEHYGAPAMLFALLIGMAFHFLYDDQKFTPGLEFSAKTLLRFGVGLLGLRLSIGDVESVGLGAVGAVVGFVMATLACGAVLSFLFGRKLAFGLLAGGSVAICGASAALAIASVLPAKDDREQDTLFVVIGVTALSTIAMIAYPILFGALGMSDLESGFLIGATIHDVAQVVGAGYSISEEAGVIATFVKMVRVALLPVVMIVVMASFRGAQSQKITLPWFLVMFVALAILTNTGLVPQVITDAIATLSGWCLVIAISALGVKTSLATILRVKPSYGIILVAETLFLLAIAVAFVMSFGF
ncbi:putative sulfate exporter family transporter [Rhodobacteraceae bacterium B1Z28]|uniref:Sulfate exporter family transporter n=1 Tax=Ruegeria haliotis TaxID=2747601 RepID=A0ABX2PYF7_9RHOB|nr:putative sulfate exporter family transporter [Ruegeria haliotis]NVO58097.1 putative sulfate exporter family transporter [Ruegeria haliotis]